MQRLVDELIPKSLDELIGQKVLNSPKVRFILKGEFDILILTGPTGTGKSSFARLLCNELCLPYYCFHASSSGSSDIKKIIDTAKKTGQGALIFIDEIHRFTKVQQDLLLDVVDEKYAKVVGASTENPFFSLTPAIRSRAHFLKFEKLDDASLKKIAERSIVHLKRSRGIKEIEFEDHLVERAVKVSGGDGRRLLNFIDAAISCADISDGSVKPMFEVDELILSSQYSVDDHYDLLSALIKSIRGSDPDAALLWCYKLLRSGVSADTIFRRLAISCSEDIGNAHPDAAVFLMAVWNLFERVGMPEGEILLSHAVTYLASCHKSNRSYEAMKNVSNFLKEHDVLVPNTIKSNSKSYKYPFEYGGFVSQDYMGIEEQFYFPSEYGFEKKIRDRLSELWKGKKRYG